MKLHEIVSARFGCMFPAKLTKPAIEYYRTHSKETRCLFIFDHMIYKKDFSLCTDDLRYMSETAPEVFSELLEAFLFAAYEDVKNHHRKTKGMIIVLEDED